MRMVLYLQRIMGMGSLVPEADGNSYSDRGAFHTSTVPGHS